MNQHLEAITDALYGADGLCKAGCAEEEAWKICDELLSSASGRPVRIIRNWIWFDIEVSEEDLEQMNKNGFMPSLIYSHYVIHDSSGNFARGYWVCTKALPLNSSPSSVVASRNTDYVLVGDGHRRKVGGNVIMSIMNGAGIR